MNEKENELNKGSFLYINDKEKAEWGYPDGYPKKNVQTTTLMEEQEVTFTKEGNAFGAVSPVNLELADGEKLTVVWDGVSYNTVVTVLQGQFPAFGNLGLAGLGDVTDYPFLYFNQGVGIYLWVAEDTATSHTISVKTTEGTITPMASDFLPQATQITYGSIKKAAHVPHVTEAPTSNDFNKLLSALREAGIMSQAQ